LEKYVKNGQNLWSSVAVIDAKKMKESTAFDLPKVCVSAAS
jgi:hypothetical protein